MRVLLYNTMSGGMDDVSYRLHRSRDRRPEYVTERHFVYHLERRDDGKLYCRHDNYGDPICSPRSLRELCARNIVEEPSIVKHLSGNNVPCSLYACLISEAILRRELQSIDYLVSSWPLSYLSVYDVIPREEYIYPDYLTSAVKGHDLSTLIDCFIVGLLNLTPDSRLRHVDFTGFSQDRRLCRELVRLPILWLSPYHRSRDVIHDMILHTIDISEDKVQRYLNRISCIYSGIDTFIRHEQPFGPVTITLDCQATLDDIPIGLALQHYTPFRFACRKLWLCPMSDVVMSAHMAVSLFNPLLISHLEVEDQNLCNDMDRFDDLIDVLLCLPNLVAFGLPNSIHVDLYHNACVDLGEALLELPYLSRLDLSSCNLRGCLPIILSPLNQTLTYLNLRDCRLNAADVQYLGNWSGLRDIQEINVSRNNMSQSVVSLTNMLTRTPLLVVLSVSYCSLRTRDLIEILQRCQVDCPNLKFIAIQNFTSPSIHEINTLLRYLRPLCSLQTCLLLPDSYAFPGNNELARRQSKTRMLALCAHEMQRHNGPYISIE